MKQKIHSFANGICQGVHAQLKIEPQNLSISLIESSTYQGSFFVCSENGIPMEGKCYCSHPRIKLLLNRLSDTKSEISFSFSACGMEEGEADEGVFVLLADGAEHSLPFTVSVTGAYPTSAIGQIKNLFDFANLAQLSFEEAYGIFRSPVFASLLKNAEKKERLLYRALGGKSASRENLEEFLIGIKKKKEVRISLSDTYKEYQVAEEAIQEILTITKHSWGYVEYAVTTDADFLIPEKNILNSGDFVGGEAQLRFLIEPDRLHGGKNWGRITLNGLYQTETFTVCVGKPKKSEEEEPVGDTKTQAYAKLITMYLSYRLGYMVTGNWTKEVCYYLDSQMATKKVPPLFPLLKAHALLENKQRQEAEWILDDFRECKHREDTPLFAYYRYLCTLWEEEPIFVQSQYAKIQEIYHEHQDDFLLSLIIFRIDESLRNSKSRSYDFLRRLAGRGSNSPILYLEAFLLVKKSPSLLRMTESFERRLLYFAIKHKCLTKDMAVQARNLIPRLKYFHVIWYEILKAIQVLCHDTESLKAICSYCISGRRFGEEEFPWYALGVKEALRITGLYEAWIRSAAEDDLLHLPKAVGVYFQYHADLDYQKKAFLYAHIIRHKDTRNNLYIDYLTTIDGFASNLLFAGKINDDLAIVYEDMLTRESINTELADALAKVAYVRKLVVSDENALYIIVVNEAMKEELRIPIFQGVAYLPIYGESFCILLEDGKKRRYGSGFAPSKLSLTPLMDANQYLEDCLAHTSKPAVFLLHYLGKQQTYNTWDAKVAGALLAFSENENLDSAFAFELKEQLVEYRSNAFSTEELDRYLVNTNPSGLRRDFGRKLAELMIHRSLYDKAYEILLYFGTGGVDVGRLLSVANHRISSLFGEGDAALLHFCYQVFLQNKYNELLLSYLCKYFAGSLREMADLFLAAEEFDADTYEMAERLLTLCVYTGGECLPDSVLLRYEGGGGKDALILAYLSHLSYCYFVKEEEVATDFFFHIGERISREERTNLLCRLAYLRYLSFLENVTSKQGKQREALVIECRERELYFAFFARMPEYILRKYHLQDLSFLEYRTKPETKLSISYEKEGESVSEVFSEMYEGIYVKAMPLFFGEECPYEIIRNGDNEVLQKGVLRCKENAGQGEGSRYDLINGMLESYYLGEMQTFEEIKGRYENLKIGVERVFRML
ncbi:hypothetical protein FACS1894111_10750 [Clostridia bacterium]|nr:hypothetical protein FACS1894111_10750 [Clostridia bacterium]